MPRNPRRRLQRPLGKRRYRKLFIIATEGSKTEPQYFTKFNNTETTVQVKCLKFRNDSSPAGVLKRAKSYVKGRLEKTDELWLVVDKDQWTDQQLNTLFKWTSTSSNYNLAVSNPMFEYWLLLHFEKGSRITANNLRSRLTRYLPNYAKADIEFEKLRPGIHDAVRRAKQKDTPPCDKWPISNGSTVYRLVEKFQNIKDR